MFRHVSRIPMASCSLHGRPSQMRRTCFPLLFKVALFSSLLAAVFGSLSSSSGQNPLSPPRNLRWNVVGAMDIHREYRVFWKASKYTGGLPVNYSVKLCVNESYAKHNGDCQWSSNPDCRPVHVLSTNKHFFCVLQEAKDFVSPCEKTCNYIISVVATNDVGSATSWRYLPFIPTYSATPFPPLSFSVKTTGNRKELRVNWSARESWKYTETEYTILYHAKNQMENETKVIKNKTEFTLLTHLEDFVEYYVYLMVRFVTNGVRSAPSEVQGPRIMRTPAGQPDTPSKVLRDQSAIYPDDPALRDVTVEWELADNASWRGTPGKYIVRCSHHLHRLGSLPNCEYHLNATTNRIVLTRLNSADKYDVYITKRNQEGKSSTSEAYIVKEHRANAASPKNKAKLSSKQIAWITVSVVVGCITALAAVYLIIKWHRGEMRELFVVLIRERVVIPPPDPDDYEYADPFPVNNYDTLLPNDKQV